MTNKTLRWKFIPGIWLSLFGILPVIGTIQAQSIQWAIVNAASFEESDQGYLHWTAGENFTTEFHSEHGTMRIGFLPFPLEPENSTYTSSLDPDIVITMYPNPATDLLYLRVPARHQQKVRILSLDGRMTMGANIQSTVTIDIQALPAGAYALYVIDPSGSFNSTTFIKS